MSIRIQGAREHNLQDIDVEFGDGLTVVTGVSGSGKTSLVFDTLYHEARRRFLDIFALGSHKRLSPAAVDGLTGLGPAIAVGQNLLNRNPNSTLASASGLHPFLRLLYARFAERLCPQCATPFSLYTEEEIVQRILSISKGSSIAIYATLMHAAYGSHATLLRFLSETFGSDALRIDEAAAKVEKSGNPSPLEPFNPHEIQVELGRWTGKINSRQARKIVRESAALGALAMVVDMDGEHETLSLASTCSKCGLWFGELRPTHFHRPCPHCEGQGCSACEKTGLHPEAAAVQWHGLRLPELLSHSVDEVCTLFQEATIPRMASRLQTEITRRLDALYKVGLGYVALDRPSPSLSRGEAQRVRLAVALTSRLEDMLHILDEPTIGQHPYDVARLLPTFRELRGPVVYVEHDRVAAASADHALDLGPGAGSQGGHLLYSGTPVGLWGADTPTGRFFSWRERVHIPQARPEPQEFLTVIGADLRNLKTIDVPIPVGRLTLITGVSGSGKSTLVEDVLVASLKDDAPHGCQRINGPPLKPVLVDQSPIGRNPRSNPATYTKLSDVVRDLFADSAGLSASQFSFNRPEGACPSCKGMGAIEVKMRYLPSTWIHCESCDGRRFADEVLEAHLHIGSRSLSVADFYNLSVSEALSLLTDAEDIPQPAQRKALRILEALRDVGLEYMPLGQPSPTLSGGEAQRVKLAKYLGNRFLAQRLFALDEPSTGLHPQDIAALLRTFDRLVKDGATIVVVEHNADVIQAADWVVDLGPGAGPQGGAVLYTGPVAGLLENEQSLTGRALLEEASITPEEDPLPRKTTRSATISVHDARMHNLKGVDVEFTKGAITVVTGVSGSGKSSLVSDVLSAEARRRFLETLSLYERQSIQEGPQASVGSVKGLGVTLAADPPRRRYEFRATVGAATELSHHLSALLAALGERQCLECGSAMRRDRSAVVDAVWQCTTCNATAPVAQPRHFSPTTYGAACTHCQGIGSLQVPNPAKLILHPERPLCDGAMHSPGFFPKGYLCKPFNYGYDMVQALGKRYGFDPASTPWSEMSPKAQQAFLFGDPESMEVLIQSRTRKSVREVTFPGFYGFIRDWDVGGTYTDSELCPECEGTRFRPEYLAVTLSGHNVHHLSEMPLAELKGALDDLNQSIQGSSKSDSVIDLISGSLGKIRRRLQFLLQVGLGYLHLNRLANTLSAGEAQRVQLAGMLGSGLTSLTVLLDEPSRGLHPSEIEALVSALHDLRDEGNTVVVVEHDPSLILAADRLVDMGPGAGEAGGSVVGAGTLKEVLASDTLTAQWMSGKRSFVGEWGRREPTDWMTVAGACANNLKGDDVRLPLGLLIGVCGVSGSGKSTLIIDTLGRALAPVKHTTSVAYEPLDPGEYKAIEGAPARTLVVDQSRAGITSPAAFFNIDGPLRKLYAASESAQALYLPEGALSRKCTACKGRGANRIDMGFLPSIFTPCDSCRGTGYLAEAWDVRIDGVSLPEIDALTLDRVHEMFAEHERIAAPLQAAQEVGLGYLVLRQPGRSLSGGEAQRLKIAAELGKRTKSSTLYLLDEPTVGQHMEDVARLTGVLKGLADKGHTVLVVEHHPHLLAACDWLVELGPGGGPQGGQVIAEGPPEKVAKGRTPTAQYLRPILESQR
jgi:excinuclease ABC subunit A